MTLWVGIVNILFKPSAASRPANTRLKPRCVVPYVGVHELFTVWDYDTQSPPGVAVREEVHAERASGILSQYVPNMLGKYKAT
jgi:hypothetical protein